MQTVWLQIFITKKIPKEKVPCKCLSTIMLDSVLNAYEKYNPHTFLEECKYVQEKRKAKNYIDGNLKIESDRDSDSETKSDADTDTNNNE